MEDAFSIAAWTDASIIELPLYKKIPLSAEGSQDLAESILGFNGRFDQYCPADSIGGCNTLT